jgi:hypothetical protein
MLASCELSLRLCPDAMQSPVCNPCFCTRRWQATHSYSMFQCPSVRPQPPCSRHWQRSLQAGGPPGGLEQLADFVQGAARQHAVVVDCTASEAVADLYESWAGAGLHVVTPNKRMGSGGLARWQGFQAARITAHSHFLCEVIA